MNKYFLMYEGDMQGRTKDDILEERKWRTWADSYVHTLSPNIYRTLPEAVDSFRYFDKVNNPFLELVSYSYLAIPSLCVVFYIE